MRTREYEILGYLIMVIYSMVVIVQTLTLYQIASPNWHVLDWIVVLAVVSLMPGLPGLMLIIPSKFLNPGISLFCRINGFVGILVSLAWGFIFTPAWWIVTLLAILLNGVVHRIHKQTRVIV